MIQPFRQVVPGGQLSAAELNRSFWEIERGTQFTVAAPLELINDTSGKHLRINLRRTIKARVTGGTGNLYTGIEQWSSATGEVIDAPGGIEFTEQYPLIEMTGATDVPEDAIVEATPGYDLMHYEFVWMGSPEPPVDSTTVKLCQPLYAPILSGIVKYHPATFIEFDAATDTWDNGPLVDPVFDCYLIQCGRSASSDNGYDLSLDLVTPHGDDGSGRYTGVKQPGVKELPVPEEGDELFERPVYATTDAPFLGPTCLVQN